MRRPEPFLAYSWNLSWKPPATTSAQPMTHLCKLPCMLENQWEPTLPGDIQVVGIQADHVYEFSDQLTDPVAAALPGAVELVLDTLVQSGISKPPKE